jgi:hypothetical protein
MSYSEKTAIVRKKPSVPIRWLMKNRNMCGKALDYGCGHGFDANYYAMEKYDPHHWPADMTEVAYRYDVIVCTYVLNVLKPEDVSVVLNEIYNLLKTGGKAYITVRRGKLAEGKTSKGFQYSVFLPRLKSIRRLPTYEIYEMTGGEKCY